MGEEPLEYYKEMLLTYSLPQGIKRLLSPLVRLLLGKRIATAFNLVKKYTPEEIDQVLMDKIRF